MQAGFYKDHVGGAESGNIYKFVVDGLAEREWNAYQSIKYWLYVRACSISHERLL